MLRDDRSQKRVAGNGLGRRAQIGGMLSIWIGSLLLVFGPAPTREIGYSSIGMGTFAVAAGTIARWLSRN